MKIYGWKNKVPYHFVQHYLDQKTVVFTVLSNQLSKTLITNESKQTKHSARAFLFLLDSVFMPVYSKIGNEILLNPSE